MADPRSLRRADTPAKRLSLTLGWVTRLGGTIWIATALHLANNALSAW